MAPPFPTPLMEDVLNARQTDRKRLDMRGHEYRLHVSDLIKMDLPWRFCSRELVLSHFEEREQMFQGLSPGFELLYEMGNTIHSLVRNKYIKSQRGASAWGSWHCECKSLVREGCGRPNPKIAANVCGKCHTPAITYREYTLYLHKYRLQGHPDFIVKWNDVYYLVEIKTIDRVDVDFDTLSAPLGDHVLQASFYYYMMKDLGFNVSQIVTYIYVDRSNKKLFRGYPYKEFRTRRSEGSRILPFLAKAQAVIDAIQGQTLPERICQTSSSTRAKNCGACLTCFERRSTTIGYANGGDNKVHSRARRKPTLHSNGDPRPANGALRPPPAANAQVKGLEPQRSDPQRPSQPVVVRPHPREHGGILGGVRIRQP